MHKSLLLTLLLVSFATLHTSAQQMLLDTNKLIIDGRGVTATNYPNADDVMIDDII